MRRIPLDHAGLVLKIRASCQRGIRWSQTLLDERRASDWSANAIVTLPALVGTQQLPLTQAGDLVTLPHRPYWIPALPQGCVA